MRFLLLLIITLFYSIGFSQTFIVSADTLEGTFISSDTPSDSILITNISGSSLQLSFKLLTNTITSVPNLWSGYICTNQYCFPSILDSGVLGVFADSEKGLINLHVSFNSNLGTGVISYKIYETSNPSNADTITFVYHLNQIVGVNTFKNTLRINLYPNPVTEKLTISGLSNLISPVVNIYSLDEKLILSENNPSQIPNINVEDLVPGIYVAIIINEEKFLKSIKFVKK